MDGGVISVCKSLMAENAVKEPSCSQQCNREGHGHKGKQMEFRGQRLEEFFKVRVDTKLKRCVPWEIQT